MDGTEELARLEREAEAKEKELRDVRARVAAARERSMAADALWQNQDLLATSQGTPLSVFPPLPSPGHRRSSHRVTTLDGYQATPVEASIIAQEPVDFQKQRLKARNPIIDWYTNQEKPWDPLPLRGNGSPVHPTSQVKYTTKSESTYVLPGCTLPISETRYAEKHPKQSQASI